MGKALYITMLTVTLAAGSSFSVVAQTTPLTDNVRFSKVPKPVPAQPAKGGAPAGSFYHSQFAGVAWGDYDNDGYMDLFYSDVNTHVSKSVVQSNLYKNNGDGTFTRLLSPFGGVAYSCPVWIDINNDGLLDMVLPGIAGYDYAWEDEKTQLDKIVTRVYVNRGPDEEGKVVFEEMADHGIRPLFNGCSGGKGHNWVSAGDYDNDGYVDLVMTGFDEAARMAGEEPMEACRVVYLYRNKGGNGFEIQKLPLGDREFHGMTDGSVEFCDLDGDGYLDIFSTGYGATRNSETHIYWNNGDGIFTEDTANRFIGVTDASCMAYDLDNDGLADLIMPGYYFNTKTKMFQIYRNEGDRRFSLADTSDLEGIDGAQISIGDVNHDGFPDILIGGHGVAHEHTTWLYINRGDMTFKAYGAHYDDLFGKAGHFSRVTHGAHQLVDYDNDGFLDAWLSGWANGGCSAGCLAELYHNDSASKGATPNAAPSAPVGLNAHMDNATGIVELSWNAATDDATPSEALRYNVYIKRKGDSSFSMTVPADMVTGYIKVSRISGEVRRCGYKARIVSAGEYEWGVQAIDNANTGGRFALGAFSADPSGIGDVVTDRTLDLSVVGNVVEYHVEGNGTLDIYATDGRSVLCSDVKGSGSLALGVEPGVYIARLSCRDENMTLKVIVR